jgi:hypothetical protein
VSVASFGSGTQTHYTGARFVLETTNASTLQLRTTAAGSFMNYSITYPTSCGAGTASLGQVFRYSFNVDETLSATLCNEGSTMFIQVYDSSANATAWFRCWRFAGNANACQRILP